MCIFTRHVTRCHGCSHAPKKTSISMIHIELLNAHIACCALFIATNQRNDDRCTISRQKRHSARIECAHEVRTLGDIGDDVDDADDDFDDEAGDTIIERTAAAFERCAGRDDDEALKSVSCAPSSIDDAAWF